MQRTLQSLPSSFSPTLARLGLATPPPFVGRRQELSDLDNALTEAPLLVVNGAVGSGKTRLAQEFAKQMESSLQVARVACAPGDLGVAVAARCERAMDRMPGSLGSVLHDEAWLVIVDDVHHLPPMDVIRLVRSVVDSPGAGRMLLLTRDLLPLPRSDARQFSMTLEGLSEDRARDLWRHLEQLYGPAKPGSCDVAIAKTRGMPLATRREYARSRHGQGAWELEDLSPRSQAVLQALCVAQCPVAPAAISVLLDKPDPDRALIDLVSRQLIDPLESGRFSVHDVVRDQVLMLIEGDRRKTLELRSVGLLRGMGRGNGPFRPAWRAGDDGAMPLLDPVDRSRQIIVHLIAAGETEAAADELVSCARNALERGAGGELLAQLAKLRSLGLGSARLDTVEAQIAVRHGRFAEAISLGTQLPSPMLAFLNFRAGNVAKARCQLEELAEDTDPDTRAHAAAILADLEISCGDPKAAEQRLAAAFENRMDLSASSRAALHLAFALLQSHRGDYCGARAALARALGCADDNELTARIEVDRIRNLVDELRYREARKLRERVESVVCEVDCIPLRDQLTRCWTLIESSVGDSRTASETLRDVISSARSRGDEIGALRGDMELAQILVDSGHLSNAAEIACAVRTSASRLGLRAFVGQSELVLAQVGLSELRLDFVEEILDTLQEEVLCRADTVRLAAIRRELRAWMGQAAERDVAESDLEAARLALARGEGASALRFARRAAVDAERLGYSRTMSLSLAIVARLELSRGQRDNAGEAATRAARDAQTSGCICAQTQALLALSALARDEGKVRETATYARDALSLAREAISPMLILVASRALEVIARDAADSREAMPNASAATASPWALAAAETMLHDLGFSASRPYRCVSAGGLESFVASANPDLLGMNERSLSVDAVRQVIVRKGEVIADLKRRSLLKRLLFLFARAPGTVFSKEEIVERVWEVQYHPLRHDAALFTNIMRIRKLLSGDESVLVTVSEDGYTMSPPADFLYLEESAP